MEEVVLGIGCLTEVQPVRLLSGLKLVKLSQLGVKLVIMHVYATRTLNRNPVSVDMQQGNGREQDRIIDLHGLHVSEAIHVLKRDLMTLKNITRPAEQRLQVYICVGTGHHTKGARTPARLLVAVQRYLLEEEGLHYFEPQPGLLRVVV